jgi:UDP-N-acetylmuramate-alanine ligase
MNLFKKLISIWKKPKVVVAIKDNQEMVKSVISQILGRSFKIEREVLFVDDLEKKDLSTKEFLILNFDDNNIQKVKEKTSAKVLTFGFKEGADFQASDIKQNDRTNFKINHQGNIVPVWLGEAFGQKEIYSVLAAVAVGTIFDLNLVEISQALTSVTK